MRKAAGVLDGGPDLPEGFLYSVKRRLLGPPLVNEQLGEQRLSKPLALGVLSPDGISSSAYGTEEILIELLPYFGLAAFTLILPFTLVILLVMLLVILSYREVVMVYIRPGGSYVVARQNFGPKIAQVCAVALLIDYIVTVAVQTAAGTAAIASTFPAIGPYDVYITIGVVLLMCFGNLRGIKEAGRFFAIPTYLFSGAVVLMIVVGLIRQLFFHLPVLDLSSVHDPIKVTHLSNLTLGVVVFTFLRAFANGGASLTGIEAVSDAVGGFRPPEGRNARQVLVTEGLILGFLVAGISWLAHATHATPRSTGYPTVLAQEADLIFGHTFVGQILFYVVQAATALILYTGANTSFNGFPFLASYVAGDAFLPRWLLKRGHRLVFSNAIILLTICSVALLIIRGSNVNNLVPLYAIGVFTAFSMAGFGMARYQQHHKVRGWRRRFVINFSAGVLTAIVVAIFAVVKFTEGAWLVVVLFVILVPALIRLNREYSMESEVLAAITGRPAAAATALHPADRVRVRGQLRPGHAGRAALRAQPAAHLTASRALRHRQRAGGEAAGRVDPGQPRGGPRLHRRARPPADPRRRGARRARGGGPGHARDRHPAPAQLLGLVRAAAARPDRGQDRRRGEPDPALGGHDRALRRAEPGPGAAGAPRAPGRYPGHPAQRQRTRRPGHPWRRRQACGTAGSARNGRTAAKGTEHPEGRKRAERADGAVPPDGTAHPNGAEPPDGTGTAAAAARPGIRVGRGDEIGAQASRPDQGTGREGRRRK